VAKRALDGAKKHPQKLEVRGGPGGMASSEFDSRELAGAVRLQAGGKKDLPPISCVCRSHREYFTPSPWYIFVRFGLCCVFHLSTKEPRHGEESKEKESEEEEVISIRVDV
jgi:hypothetical protein